MKKYLNLVFEIITRYIISFVILLIGKRMGFLDLENAPVWMVAIAMTVGIIIGDRIVCKLTTRKSKN